MEAALPCPVRCRPRVDPAMLLQRLIYLWRFRRWPRLTAPRTFNEHVQHRKLFERDARWPVLADKVAVKDHVRRVLGAEWVTPTWWHGTRLPTAPAWPFPFVLKSSHASQQLLFLRSAADMPWPAVAARAHAWLDRRYAAILAEWLYAEIEPRLLIEPFIGAGGVLPLDYKFLVFGGRVEIIQVDTDREHAHKRVLFDRHWRRLPVAFEFPIDPRPLAPPSTLHDMIAAAEALAAPFDFVRIDFYEVAGRPRFGEMTFYPGSGLDRFRPHRFDALFGDYWRAVRSR